MTFDVHQIGAAPPVVDAGPKPLTRPGATSCAAVYDLTAKLYEASRPVIPDELWDEVDAAARTAAELDRTGHALRFDHRFDGRLIVRLYSNGSIVRHMSLSEVVDVGSSGPPEAA